MCEEHGAKGIFTHPRSFFTQGGEVAHVQFAVRVSLILTSVTRYLRMTHSATVLNTYTLLLLIVIIMGVMFTIIILFYPSWTPVDISFFSPSYFA